MAAHAGNCRKVLVAVRASFLSIPSVTFGYLIHMWVAETELGQNLTIAFVKRAFAGMLLHVCFTVRMYQHRPTSVSEWLFS